MAHELSDKILAFVLLLLALIVWLIVLWGLLQLGEAILKYLDAVQHLAQLAKSQ